jgi:hypothetical protein
MFYKKEEVDSVLLCSICSEVFQDNDPRILPCGESACQTCILKSSNSDSELDCSFCHQKHKPCSVDGFLSNLAILKLIKTKADQVYRNPSVEKLRSKLAKVTETCADLRDYFTNGTAEAREHCDELRSQVQLQTDILLEQVHRHNQRMLAEIDEYEKQCFSSFNSKSSNYQAESIKLFAEVDTFCTLNSNYLTRFKIDDKEIESSIQLAERHLTKIQDTYLNLGKIKLAGKLLVFKQTQLDERTFGALVDQKLDIFSHSAFLASSKELPPDITVLSFIANESADWTCNLSESDEYEGKSLTSIVQK